MTHPSDSSKIILRDIHKGFGSKKILQGIDLDVKSGESVVIIGGSGTGKSVTLKCILGLLTPDKGDIFVDGQDIRHLKGTDRDAYMRKFGMLFQGAALFDSLSIWENVGFGLIQGQGISKKDAKEAAIKCLASVGLGSEVATLFPAELSGGMQKRVGLARAIACNPEIIFFDEPTTGLDPIMGDVINDLIAHTVRERGATALSITHDMSSVRKIADRVAMLYQGRIIWTGTVQEMDNCDNPYVQQFIHGRAEGPIQMAMRS